MRMREIDYDAMPPVDGYGPGVFRIGGTLYRGAVLVLPGGRVSGWAGFADLDALTGAAGEIDVLILGTGPEMAPPPPAFRAALEAAGIGVEFMASPAACRTYNVVLSEGRRVALALLPV